MRKKRVVSWIFGIIIVACIVLAGYFTYKYFDDINKQYANAELALKKSNTKIKSGVDYRGKHPKVGTVIGTIEIDGLTSAMPIIEGVDEQLALAHGVGHVDGTSLPGEGLLAAFSGHRETFFRSLRDIKAGDIVKVVMPYGTYKYKINKTMIATLDKASVKRVYSTEGIKDERIALITCYPFESWAFPSKRYVVYGDLISELSSDNKVVD